MSKHAVIYARVSTDEQGRGYSLPTQIEACQRYAAEHGYTIVTGPFQDEHTGTELERPGLNALRTLVRDRGVDVVIVYDIDRLARKVVYQLILEEEFNAVSVRIEYVLGQYADTPEGNLMKSIKATIAEYENAQRIERSRRGKLGRAQAGYVIVTPGRTPFGYTYISEPHRGTLEINEAEAAVFRQIVHWLTVDRLSSYTIARKLWEAGILSRGDTSTTVHKKTGRGEWSPSTIRNMLANPVYKGVWYYGKTRRRKVNGKFIQERLPESEWIAVPVPAILDPETWDHVQACLARNKRDAKRNTKREYLLRSMVYCRCGRRWIGLTKKRSKHPYYRCRSNEAERWRSHCDLPGSLRQDVLETTIWETVKASLLNSDALQRGLDERKRTIQGEIEHNLQRLQAITASIAEIDRQMGILLDQMLTHGFAQSLIDQRKHELIRQRDELTEEAERLKGEMQLQMITPEQQGELLAFAARVFRGLNHFTFEEKRRALQLLDIRVDMLSLHQARLSGKLAPEHFVDISSRVMCLRDAFKMPTQGNNCCPWRYASFMRSVYTA